MVWIGETSYFGYEVLEVGMCMQSTVPINKLIKLSNFSFREVSVNKF
jgi:hypothetical protein